MADDQPDLSTIPGRLEWARRKRGYSSPRAAAASNRWSENTYKAHEQGLRGSEGLKTATAERYAKAFGIRVEWLTTGRGDPFPKSELQREWDDLDEERQRMALRLVRAADRHGLIDSTPPEEIDTEPLPPWFKKTGPDGADPPNVHQLEVSKKKRR